MDLNKRVAKVINGEEQGLFSTSTPSLVVWKELAIQLKRLKALEIEADDKQLMDWAVQLTQVVATNAIDVKVSLQEIENQLADISSSLETIADK